MRRLTVAAIVIALLGATPTRVANPLQLLSWMPGDWVCTVTMMGHTQTYQAHFAYAQGGAWMNETDTWDGGSDQAQFTYVAAKRVWRSVVTESDGNVTVFEAPDTGLAHVAYASVYPDKSMSDTFDRITTSRYTMHFVQKTPKTTIIGHDVCVKKT